MKMEPIRRSETSAIKTQTPGNYPKRNILQEKDSLCIQYRRYENFWTDEDGVLYYQEGKGRPRIVIPETLVRLYLLLITSYPSLHIREYIGLYDLLVKSIGGKQ